MSEHDWAPIAPRMNDVMCRACLQCQCCETPTEECPGEWIPSEDDFNTRLFLDQWGGVS